MYGYILQSRNHSLVATDRPAEARGFIHKKAFGLLKKTFGPAVDIGAQFVPGGSIVREALKQVVRGPRPVEQPIPLTFAGLPQRAVVPVQLPPTPTMTTPAERSIGPEFQAVTGAFGMPAMAPFAETRVVLDCPPGMVLGKDDLCYPSAVLRRNSQFRKWRSAPRPTVTRRDERALARIDAVQKALKRLGKKAGLKVTG